MNNININVELCTEDRARLDKIISLLETRSAQAQVDIEAKYDKQDEPKVSKFIAETLAEDAVTQMAREALEGSKTAQDAPKVPDHPTPDPFPELPAVADQPNEATIEKAKPAVTMDMLRAKAITLAAAGKKDKVREVVQPYAAKVTELSEDVWAEVYEKLVALEG